MVQKVKSSVFDTQALEALLTLSRCGSFREAAQALGISPPTLTRTVKAAEAAIGFPLFHRERTGVVATGPGRQVLEECESLLAGATRFSEAVAAIGTSGGGALSIGCGPLPTGNVVRPLISAITRQWPGIGITVQVHADIDPVTALRERALDLFLGDLSHTTAFDDLEIVTLRRHAMSIVAAPEHPIHQRAPCSLADLVSFPTALPFLHRYWRKTFETHITRSTGVPVPPGRQFQQVTCDDFSLLIALAKTGQFVTGGSPEHFADAIRLGSLVDVPMAETVLWNLCAARLRNNRFDALDYAWDWLQRHRTG